MFLISEGVQKFAIINGETDEPYGFFGITFTIPLPESVHVVIDPNKSELYFSLLDEHSILYMKVGALSILDCIINGALQYSSAGLLESNCGVLGNAIDIKDFDVTWALALNPITKILYVSDSPDCANSIAIIDTDKYKVLKIVAVPTCFSGSLGPISMKSGSLYFNAEGPIIFKLIGSSDSPSVIESYLGGSILNIDIKGNVYVTNVYPNDSRDLIYVLDEANLTSSSTMQQVITDESFNPSQVAQTSIDNINAVLNILEKIPNSKRRAINRVRLLTSKLDNYVDSSGIRCRKKVEQILRKLDLALGPPFLKYHDCAFTLSGIGDVVGGVLGANPFPGRNDSNSKKCIPHDQFIAFHQSLSAYYNSIKRALENKRDLDDPRDTCK